MANINLTLTPASPTGSLVFTIGMPGPGVPPSGLTGQILAKASNASYDTEWVNPLDVSAVWGQITGTLSNQTDLQTALDGKYSTSNPSGFINSSALTPYLTSANAASTYQTLSGMSSYLTISSAASTYQTQAAMSSYLTTSAAESIYYPLTNPAGYIDSSALIGYALESWVSLELAGKAPLAAGVPVGGTTGQLLVKSSNTDYATGWTTIIPGDRYLTNSTTSLLIGNGSKTLTVGTGLSYSATQDATISLTSDQNNFHMHGKVVSYNSATGQLVVDVQNHTGSGTFNAWTVNVGGISPVATLAWGNITGTLSNQLDLQTALDGKYSTTNPAGYITSSALSPYLLSATAASTYQTQSGMSSYALLASPTFTGDPKAPTPSLGDNDTSIATTAFVKGQGYATTSALSAYAALAGATFSGNITFTANAKLILPGGPPDSLGSLVGQIWTDGTGNFWVAIADDTIDYLVRGQNLSSTLANYANLTSPTFLGDPKAPTPATADNDTSIATTAFVKNQGYAQLSGAAFTGNVTASSNSISARRIIGQPNAGVAGVNIGIGGDSTNSTTAGDIWIVTGGTSLNFRDGTGAWRQCISTSSAASITTTAVNPVLSVTQNGNGGGLRIVNNGTGDSLYIDNGTPDVAFTVNADGRVGIGVAPHATADLRVTINGIAFPSNVLNNVTMNTGTAIGDLPTQGYPDEVYLNIDGVTWAMPARQLP